jgi:glycogen operon protein
MDSLRYWITQMGIDGFRFDLASSLARELHEVDRLGSFFDTISQDPTISRVKLIAEPWDVGEGGYQVGNFPPLWSEWNGKYRDTVRDYWRGAERTLGEFAYRLHRAAPTSTRARAAARSRASTSSPCTTGSPCTTSSRTTRSTTRPTARTTRTGERTTAPGTWARKARRRPEINARRARQKRNFLATLMLSQGVPMLLAGDELGRTAAGEQQRLQPGQRDLLGGLGERGRGPPGVHARLIDMRRRHPVFRRRRWFQGRPIHGSDVTDIAGSGRRLADGRRGLARGPREVPRRVPERRAHGQHGSPRGDPSWTTASTSSSTRTTSAGLPDPGRDLGKRWLKVLDTFDPAAGEESYGAHAQVPVQGLSLVVLRRAD